MKAIQIRFIFFSMVLAEALLHWSCGGSGTVSLLLTDAPGDFKKAVVTIEQIYLQGEGSEGRVVLRDTPVTTDLITLANEATELVKDVDVPAGRYSQLRFVISGGYLEVDEGDGHTALYASSDTYPGLPAGAVVTGALQMPSYGSSGLKIDIGPLEVAGSQHVVLVDFDVAQSFGHGTGTAKWVMHPVVKGAELRLSSTVEVTLTPAIALTLPAGVTLGDFKATLTNAAGSKEELAFTDANGDGTAEVSFRYVMPGDFVLDLVGPGGSAPSTDPARPTAITLASGESMSRAYVLTGL